MTDRPTPPDDRSELPQFEPDESDLDETRAASASRTRGMDAPVTPAPMRRPPGGQRQPHAAPIVPLEQQRRPPPQSRSPHQGRARRRRSGMYLPLWSLALMLIVVFGTAGGIILLILSLGGDPPADSPPVLIIRTAAPTETPDSFPVVPASATIPPEFVPDRTDPENFALAGPTLVTPFMTPTPRPLALGETIIVTDVLPDQLNIRDQPGVTTGSFIVFQANEGARFTIVDGPRQADGLTWWRIQDPNNASIVGWAASIYLRIEQE